MSGKITVHAGIRFSGSDLEVENLELEELTQDPTDIDKLSVGRVWINTVEERIKCVTHLDEQNQPVIQSLLWLKDYNNIINSLQNKADKATTIAGYNITDAASKSDLQVVENAYIQAPGTIGFVNGKQDSLLSFNNSTRTFTIAPLNTSYSYYVKGKHYSRTEDVNIQIADIEGLWFFYFDDMGQLQTSQIPWDLFSVAPIAIAYWNSNLQAMQFMGEERHASVMDPATHAYAHFTQGTKYRKGFVAHSYNLEGDGSSNEHAQLGISDGVIQDEDIVIAINHNSTPTQDFQQVLSSVGYFPVMYRYLNSWVRETPTSFALKTGTSCIYYNTYDSQNNEWLIQEAPQGSFVAMFLMATNAQVSPITAVMGQGFDVTLDDAKNNNDFAALNWGTIPFTEFKGLYRLIFQTNSTYANDAKARLVAVDDLRNIVSVSVSAIPTTAHGDLTGLLEDNHSQYIHSLIDRIIRAQHTFDPTSQRPAFLLGSNAQGQLIPGLNAAFLGGLSSEQFQPASAELLRVAQNSGAGVVKRDVNGVYSTSALTAFEIPNLSWNKITSDKPTTVAGYGIIDILPTNIIKIVSGSVAIQSGTNTNILVDNTTPLITEGLQLVQQTLTPLDSQSCFLVDFSAMIDTGTKDRSLVLTLFRRIGSGSWLFLGYTAVLFNLVNAPQITRLFIPDTPQTTEDITYMIRIGLSGNGSWYLGRTRDRTMGGINPSTYSFIEFRP